MGLPSAVNSVYVRGYFAARRLLGITLFEKLRFLITHHRWPRLARPITFTDKILARKLGAPDARFPIVADKVAVREWVAQRIGSQHLVPALAIYDYQDLDKLDVPPGQVIKCANRSGGVYFTSTDDGAGRARLINTIRKDLDFDFAAWTGEPWYSEIPKRVIAEKSLSDENGTVPIDYKFFVFHGTVQVIQVHLDRFLGNKRAIFDREWRLIPLGNGTSTDVPARPKSLPRMLEIAETLGKEFDFVRIDLYQVDDDSVYFGEMTLAPGSGLNKFDPVEYDRIFGEFW